LGFLKQKASEQKVAA
ncbi:bacteriophage recombination protein, partial [Escherichia coli 10.0833]